MTSGHMRGPLIFVAALVLCLWVAGIAAAQIPPVNYEWYQGDVHRAKVEETFIPAEALENMLPGPHPWYYGPEINCWEYTVDVDPGLYVDIFTIHASAVALVAVYNDRGWTDPLVGPPLDDITWTVGTGTPLNGGSGTFRIWAEAERGIITGSLHCYGIDATGAPVDGTAGGDVSGPVTTPEPGSLVLLVCGIAGAGGLLRRRLS